ncbi:MAG: CYTH domain-containing protein [Lachnospiraceae bacterium]|nr:CYTH domain-containing protein [Lachnospiraceae bacterium]
MEIERKFLVKKMPEDLERYPGKRMEQAYLTTDPVIRVRKEEFFSKMGDGKPEKEEYILTYKGKGLMAREEHNLPLTIEAYETLAGKAEGNVIRKKRYLLPIENTGLTVELDVFMPPFAPLVMAEVEFGSMEEAEAFEPPSWFGEEVTEDPAYHNSTLSRRIL